jgi:sucrose-6F-phosphate phosphohydrolase
MKPPRIRLLCCDLDGTLLPANGLGSERVERFTVFWNGLPSRSRPLLCYNSGRLVADLRASVIASGLPLPDYFIGGVGTSLRDGAGRPVEGFSERFRAGWERSLVQEVLRDFPGVTRQPARCQSPFKSSWFLHQAPHSLIEAIAIALAAVELQVMVVYSSDRDLDVLPEQAGKGNALAWLCRHLRLPAASVVVAGDTENDLAMFRLPQVRGIAVANANAGLLAGLEDCAVYRAETFEADGVLEGLRHYGLESLTPPSRSPRRRPGVATA